VGTTSDGGNGSDFDGTAGVCPVLVDAGADAADAFIPGLCPYPDDAAVDAGIGPGLCPFPIDGGPDASCDPGYGGIC
jgi:hypothetical protein